jgi:hypothetical protein
MSLKEIWNKVSYGFEWIGFETVPVTEDLKKQNWTFETAKEPVAILNPVGAPAIVWPTIVRDPEGRSIKDDSAVRAQYEAARLEAAARLYKTRPAP